MMRFWKKRLSLALGVAACVAAPFVTQAETPSGRVTLTPAQMQQVAKESLRSGNTAQALAFADALLVRDPADVIAHLTRSHALRSQGKYGAAKAAAQAAWRNSSSDADKFSSAMMMAQALSSDGKRTRAQLWLRRAAQVAPTPAHAARAARDFKYVQRRNPWQTHLSFTLAPNSNINNGSSRDSSVLLYRLLNPFNVDGAGEITLGAASKALSGIETGVNVQSRYRFHQTERTAHDLRLGLSYRTYHLSKSSKDALAEDDAERVATGRRPLDLKGSNYAYGSVQVGYGFKQLRLDRRGEFSLNADIGQTFYAGARYNSFVRASLGQTYYVDRKTKLNFGLTGERRNAQRGTDQDMVSLSAGLSKQLANGNGLYIGASATSVSSETERAEYDEVRLRGGYVLGREVMGTALQFGLSTSFRDYDISPHDPSGREELQIAAEATATFKKVDYFGFNPTVSLSASSTNSNIGLYDVNRVGLSIGIASAF